MSNITVTNIDNGSVVLANDLYRDDLLTFTSAETILAGTILARDTGTLKLVPFVIGGITDGIPQSVITYDVTSTGAGDVPVQALVSGEVNRQKLLLKGDSPINITDQVLDQLRDYSIISIDVQELAQYDNQ